MKLETRNWADEINLVPHDPNVSIRFVKLSEHNSMALFVSVIEAGGSVTGHYHEHSSEDYHIVDGEGIIATLPAEELGSLASPEKVKIKAGMSFSVSARCVHRLFNNSSKPLTFLFHCPLNHLSTDRIIVPNFAD